MKLAHSDKVTRFFPFERNFINLNIQTSKIIWKLGDLVLYLIPENREIYF